MNDKVSPNPWEATYWAFQINATQQLRWTLRLLFIIIFLPKMATHAYDGSSDLSDCFRSEFAEIWRTEEPGFPHGFCQLQPWFPQIYWHISRRWPLWTVYLEFSFPMFEDWTSTYCLESKSWKGTEGVSRNQNCRLGWPPGLVEIFSSRLDNLW